MKSFFPSPKPHLAALAILALSAVSANAQVGGKYDTLHRIEGESGIRSFGEEVASAGDINNDGFGDFLVGAPLDKHSSMVQAGSVHVYSGATLAVLYQLFGTFAGQNLGDAISGAGDVNGDGFDDFVVGSGKSSPGGVHYAGIAWVYSGADGSVIHQINGSWADGNFGYTVSGAGDVDGDGFGDFMVGGYNNNWGENDSVFVYSGANGLLIHTFNAPINGYGFGRNVAGGGDLDGDGFDDLLVAAEWSDLGGRIDSGTIFAYSGATGAEFYRIHGRAPDEVLGRHALGFAGDIDADGNDDIIIGAPGDGWMGTVYVHSGDSGIEIHKIHGNSYEDNFAISASGAGDWDQDGYDDFIVGAPWDWSDLSGGEVFVYSGLDKRLLYRIEAGNDAEFGSAVCFARDVTGDGFGNCIVGAKNLAASSGSKRPGGVGIIGFNPHLTLSSDSISAANGGTVTMDINFPIRTASYEYKTLISSTGTGPTHYGVDIPLTADSLAIDTFNGIYPVPTYSDLHGTLDVDGNSSASMTVPAGLPSTLIGSTYWFAAIAFQPGGIPEHSSVARGLTITP